MRMHFGPFEFLFMALLACAGLIWIRHRRFHEYALGQVREYCSASGLQLLDSTIAFRGFRIDWTPLQVCRSFRFDYSLNGVDRHRGLFTLCGENTQSFRVDPAHLHASDVDKPDKSAMPRRLSDWGSHL